MFTRFRQQEEEVARLRPDGRTEMTPDGRFFVFPKGTPQFLVATYMMLENPETQDIVSWDWGTYSQLEEEEKDVVKRDGAKRGGRRKAAANAEAVRKSQRLEYNGYTDASDADNPCRLVIHDVQELEDKVLPNVFKHNRLTSFVRQLNSYGFRKVRTSAETFVHPMFRRTNLESVGSIRRKNALSRVGGTGGGGGKRGMRRKRNRDELSVVPEVMVGGFDRQGGLVQDEKRQRQELDLQMASGTMLQQVGTSSVDMPRMDPVTGLPEPLGLSSPALDMRPNEMILLKAQMSVLMQRMTSMQVEMKTQQTAMLMMERELEETRAENRRLRRKVEKAQGKKTARSRDSSGEEGSDSNSSGRGSTGSRGAVSLSSGLVGAGSGMPGNLEDSVRALMGQEPTVEVGKGMMEFPWMGDLSSGGGGNGTQALLDAMATRSGSSEFGRG